jgi:hypothetical protein
MSLPHHRLRNQLRTYREQREAGRRNRLANRFAIAVVLAVLTLAFL